MLSQYKVRNRTRIGAITRATTLQGFGVSFQGLAGFDKLPAGSTPVTVTPTTTTNWWGSIGSTLTDIWSAVSPVVGNVLETEKLKQQAKTDTAQAEIARQAILLEQVRSQVPITTMAIGAVVVGLLGYWYLSKHKK